MEYKWKKNYNTFLISFKDGPDWDIQSQFNTLSVKMPLKFYHTSRYSFS